MPATDTPQPKPRRLPDGSFANPGTHVNRTWPEILRWKLTARPACWPRRLVDQPQQAPQRPAVGFVATWIGHSTFLLRTQSVSVLVDPVWSPRAGPLGLLGPARVRPPGLAIDELPALDVILLTHDHYDHCDLPTLRKLSALHPGARLLAPLGFEGIAARAGFVGRTTVLDWWEQATVAEDLGITATPARHWSNRLEGARNSRLWCGWHLRTPEATLLHVGDTAYDPEFFPAIRAHLGPPDLALIPIGAYAPRWFMQAQHCDPAEAVRIHRDLGARRSVGMHWGTFQLTDEPINEPRLELERAANEAGLARTAFITVRPGETVATH